MIICLENKVIAEKLLVCDDWGLAEYRYPNPIQEWRESHATACNVKRTGKMVISWHGCYWVRGQVEWVGDGEPSTFCKCKIATDWEGKLV